MRASRVAIRLDILLNVYPRPTLSASGAGLPPQRRLSDDTVLHAVPVPV